MDQSARSHLKQSTRPEDARIPKAGYATGFIRAEAAGAERLMRRIYFKRPLIFKILRGEKTQTRRLSDRFRIGEIYRVNSSEIWILITRKYQQRLGDITPEEIRREGFSSLKEFQDTWKRIYGRWNPDAQVWTYEFKVISPLYLQTVYTVSRRRRS